MPDVVLLYERSCPNAGEARANLSRAFADAGLPASWRELDVDGSDTPEKWRTFGSPTILVDGVDVAGGAPADGATCRIYERSGRLAGAPSVDQIVARLRAMGAPSPAPKFRALLATVPGIGVALLPNLACPACWPAYAAVLSALGLGFLMRSRYLLPLTIALLALATFAIAFRAKTRRGYAPAIVAAFAGAALVIAKFAADWTAGTYVATAVVAGSAVWNAWPVRASACPACLSDSKPKPSTARTTV
jgi:hypothetical protein